MRSAPRWRKCVPRLTDGVAKTAHRICDEIVQMIPIDADHRDANRMRPSVARREIDRAHDNAPGTGAWPKTPNGELILHALMEARS